MKACMVENGMHFDEKEVSDLATALFEDAVQVRRLGVVEMVVEMELEVMVEMMVEMELEMMVERMVEMVI